MRCGMSEASEVVVSIGEPIRNRELSQFREMSQSSDQVRSQQELLQTAPADEVSEDGSLLPSAGAFHRLRPSAGAATSAVSELALSWLDVLVYRQYYGMNVIAGLQPRRWYQVLYGATLHPFNLVLLFLGTISGATGDYRTLTVMVAMVFLSIGLRFLQEMKSEVAAEGLKKMIKAQATVLRRHREPEGTDPTWEDAEAADNVEEFEIPIDELVPGDIIKLSAGVMIPADVRLIGEAKDLFVSQSALTGESMPLEKLPLLAEKDVEEQRLAVSRISVAGYLLQREVTSAFVSEGRSILSTKKLEAGSDFCFMGSSVVSGSAKAMVVQTGSGTVFGDLAKQLSNSRPKTAFQIAVNRIAMMFICIMAVMLPTVFVVSSLVQGDWFQGLLFAVAVAVGLTPEMLPMIVSGCLAMGAVRMARQRCIIKRSEAIVDFGSMNVLCTDKTGTLTHDKVVLLKHLDIGGCRSSATLLFAMLNSYFQTGLKNLLDLAILHHVESADETFERMRCIRDEFAKVDEIPFDFVRRRMSVILVSKTDGRRVLVTKGAVDEMLSVCTLVATSVAFSGAGENSDLFAMETAAMTDEYLVKARELSESMNREGLRCVAVACKTAEPDKQSFGNKDEHGLTFLGFVAFLDPPKESAGPAIADLLKKGVDVKVLTGDSPLVCQRVCSELKLPINRVVVSNDLRDMSDEEMRIIAQEGTIFARLTPVEKAKVVRALRANGLVVGFLGDGINDAPALRAADVGISVDSGADIAKESADIILLDKDLTVLVAGVMRGRETFANMMKYMKMAVSSNFGNVFSVLGASAWLPFLPMLPIHILVQNFLYDCSQLAIPWDNIDEEMLEKPVRFSVGSIVRFMVCMGPISSIFDYTTFILMWFYYGIQTPSDNVTLFQTAWFLEGLLTQTSIVHMIRTRLLPIIESRPSVQLALGTLAVMVVAVALPFSPLNSFLSMVPLPGLYFAYVVGVLISYCAFAQIGKTLYLLAFDGDWI